MRTKTIFGRNTAHIWANAHVNGIKTGKNRSGGNLSFRGKELFSYATVIAEIVQYPKGRTKGIATVSPKNYSVTTNKHQGMAYSALGNKYHVFSVDNYFRPDQLSQLEKRYLETLGKSQKARNSARHLLRRAKFEYSQAVLFAKLFKLKTKIEPPTKEQVDVVAKAGKRAKELEKTKAERAPLLAIKRQKRLMKELERQIQEWRNGGYLRITWNQRRLFDYQIPALLRIKGDNLETSLGAKVPLEHAKSLYRHMILGHDITGARIGHFQIDSWNNGVLKAGCHKIEFDEINRLHDQLTA